MLEANKTRQISANVAQAHRRSMFFNPVIQPKLAINQANGIYEQEADLMADKVMRMPASQPVSFFKPTPVNIIQRQCDHCEKEEKKQLQRKEIDAHRPEINNDGVEKYIGSLDNSGSPLPQQTRSFFEPKMGYDFSQVKVHTDAVAANSAQSINALAYTTGKNIVFNTGQYSPGTESGKRLLGHELTHVVQQNQGNGSVLQRQDFILETPQPLGPIGQAKADCVAALKRTSERVKHAIYNRDQAIPVPHDVEDALTRFFPGTQYNSFEDLLARIEPMIEWLPNIQIRIIPPIPVNDIAIIKKVHNKALAANDPPAFAVAPGLGSYIALYPLWYAEPLLQATRLLHEAYHYSFPVMRGHPKNKPWENPVAFQGFVSVLGGLPIGDFPNKQYPSLIPWP